jgi:hypothetical protein
LQGLFPVPNSFKVVGAATCLRQVGVKRQQGCKDKRS